MWNRPDQTSLFGLRNATNLSSLRLWGVGEKKRQEKEKNEAEERQKREKRKMFYDVHSQLSKFIILCVFPQRKHNFFGGAKMWTKEKEADGKTIKLSQFVM